MISEEIFYSSIASIAAVFAWFVKSMFNRYNELDQKIILHEKAVDDKFNKLYTDVKVLHKEIENNAKNDKAVQERLLTILHHHGKQLDDIAGFQLKQDKLSK